MRNLFKIILTSLGDLSRSKIKTGLSALGILIGVFAVVILQSFGNGLNNYLLQQFESLGANTVYVVPGDPFKQSGASSIASTISFNPQDVAKLQRLPDVLHVVPVAIKRTKAEANGQSKTTDVYATSEDLFAVRSLEATHGKLFDNADIGKKQKVVVLGPKIARELYGSEGAAIGKKIRLGVSRYTVMGVIEEQGGQSLGGPDFDSYTYIPYSAVGSLMQTGEFSSIYLQAKNAQVISKLQDEAKASLSKDYKEKDFSVIDQGQILSAAGSIFGVVNGVLLVIGSVSLLVGGVGIMNIMYATVTERIKEIGIRRSLGARKSDVMQLFIAEAVLLSAIGGLFGLLLASGAVIVIRKFFPVSMDINSILIALGVSSGIGVFFGVFPARRAASWPPIDAIRSE